MSAARLFHLEDILPVKSSRKSSALGPPIPFALNHVIIFGVATLDGLNILVGLSLFINTNVWDRMLRYGHPI